MRSLVLVLAAVVAASPALARPLPPDTHIALVKGALAVTSRGVTVPLVDDTRIDIVKLASAELSDDGKTYVVKVFRCDEQAGVTETDEPVAVVSARVENVLGMQLHLKKRYADAMPHFVAAITADPDSAVYATNLLSAQSMAGTLDDADAALAKYGPHNRAWFAWRLLVDPELDHLKARPAAIALRAARPGTLRVADLHQEDRFSTSSLGLVAAMTHEFDGGPGGPVGTSLSISDLAGNRLLRLAVVELGDGCDPSADARQAFVCSASTKATIAAREKVADQVLAALGFGATTTFASGQDDNRAAKLSYPLAGAEEAFTVAFTPTAVVMITRERHVRLCDDDSGRTYLRAYALP